MDDAIISIQVGDMNELPIQTPIIIKTPNTPIRALPLHHSSWRPTGR